MSHFTVMVSGEDLETQMLPFAEQSDVCPAEHLEFNDVEDEYRKKYEEETHQEFYCASSSSWGQVIGENLFSQIEGKPVGTVVQLAVSKKDVDMMHYWKLDSYYDCGQQEKTHKCPTKRQWVKVVEIVYTTHPDPAVCFEGVIKVQLVNPPKRIAHNVGYADFDQFMEEYAGYSKDDKTGRYGYWHNPNAKWDFWSVGGRWAGKFPIKPEFKHLYSGVDKLSWEWGMDKKMSGRAQEVVDSGRVDSALKEHVDWDAIMNKREEESARRYDFVMKNIIENLPANESWETFRDGKDVTDTMRDDYWKQPRCAAWKKFTEDQKNRDVLEELGISMWDGSPDDYLCSRERYIESARRNSITTFAVLHEGKWAERGKMGWWACVSNEKDNWEDIFKKILDKIPDGTRLTVLDCHI